MKILVFSDSHGTVRAMHSVVAWEKPDRILHLGDVVRDAADLADAYPNIPVESVCGNCDYNREAPLQTILNVQGRRILMTHGHTYHVKVGMGAAVQAARAAQVDILLFGHTHEAFCRQDDGLWVMNPGSIRGYFCPTYGVITLTTDTTTCEIREYTDKLNLEG
ncbi:MAG: YfcE family phosphodiesterase [Pseudoflavonifractor sp.]